MNFPIFKAKKTNFKAYAGVILSLFIGQLALAQILVGGNPQQSITIDQLMVGIPKGAIVIIGEAHYMKAVRDQQMQLLTALRQAGHTVSVGLEFFKYPDMDMIRKYQSGLLEEEDFKNQIKWGSSDFSLYRDQLLFPRLNLGEAGLGINIPSAVTSYIGKNGLLDLPEEHLKYMPPDFQLGRDPYFQRFKDIMASGHPMPEARLQNLFAAQSVWDETMAWQSINYIENNLTQTFVIIVGEFHVQYGGGLPDRLKARLMAKKLNIPIVTISQIPTEGLTEEELKKEIMPSPEYGQRADFILLSK